MAEVTPLERLRDSGLLTREQVSELAGLPEALDPDPKVLGRVVVQRGWLTKFQARRVAVGKGKGLLIGPYVLLDRLGEGGMGTVLKARHRHMKRVVALKLIREGRLGGADGVARFYQEVEAASQLHHPNIVLAFDAGQADGTHFFAMEYVEGADLAAVVRGKGALPVAQACDFIRQAAVGLQHAHERGLVHRDIKPSNLLLAAGPSSVVKILDMGLARLGDSFAGERGLTKPGQMLGTPAYLAPEQALDARGADIRADIYGLGCSLFFLLTGRAPFRAESLPELLMKHQAEEPTPIRSLRLDVSEGLAALLRRMMAKKPEGRPGTPAEVAEALKAFCAGGSGVEAVSMESADQPPEPSARPKDRTRAALSGEDSADAETMSYGGPRSRARRAWSWPLWAGVAAGGVLLALLVFGAVALLRPAKTSAEVSSGNPPPAEGRPAAPPAPVDAGTPIDWTCKVAFTMGKTVPGRVAAFLDDRSFLTFIGTFIKLRSVPDGDELGSFDGHSAVVHSVALSRDGTRMASSDQAKNVLIWDVRSRTLLKTITAKQVIHSLAFSPDGRRLAGGGTPVVRLWDVETGDEVSNYNGKRGGELILQVGFTPDGLSVASGGQTFRVWDTRTGATTLQTGPMGGLMRFAMSKDGGHFYLATSQKHLYQLTPGNLRRLNDGQETVWDVSFTPGYRRLLVGFVGLVGVADPETGNLLASHDLSKEQGWRVVSSPNGRFLAAVGTAKNESRLIEVRQAAPAIGR